MGYASYLELPFGNSDKPNGPTPDIIERWQNSSNHRSRAARPLQANTIIIAVIRNWFIISARAHLMMFTFVGC